MDGRTYVRDGWMDRWMDGWAEEKPNVLPATNSLGDDHAYELNTRPQFARRCAYRRLDFAVDFIRTYLHIAVYALVSVISVDALTAISLPFICPRRANYR